MNDEYEIYYNAIAYHTGRRFGSTLISCRYHITKSQKNLSTIYHDLKIEQIKEYISDEKDLVSCQQCKREGFRLKSETETKKN